MYQPTNKETFMSTRYFSCSCHLNPEIVCRHDRDPFNALRMRTDWTIEDFNGLSKTQVERINASNARYNELTESIETMNFEIAMRQIDNGDWDKPKKKSKKVTRRKVDTKSLFEDCPEEVMADLMEDGFDLDQ
jgi:hypothetical protein